MTAQERRWSVRSRVLLGGVLVLTAGGALVPAAHAGNPAGTDAAKSGTAQAGTAAAGAEPSSGDQDTRQKMWAADVEQRHEERLVQSIWWNREPISIALSLTEAQRKEMDRLLAGALESRRTAALDVRDAREEFDRALIAGKWKAAEGAGERLSRAVAAYSREESGLKLAVISQLDAAQRQTLADRYSAILKRPWLLGMGRRVAERGEGRVEGQMGRRGMRRPDGQAGDAPRGERGNFPRNR